MAGMSDLGGVKFFNLSVDTPEGDMEVLEFVMEGEWSVACPWVCSLGVSSRGGGKSASLGECVGGGGGGRRARGRGCYYNSFRCC
jgi:hypothetical protein